MTFHTPEDVRDALARCFLRNGVDRPQWTADLVMPVVEEVLGERDREIGALTGRLADLAVQLRGLLDTTGKDSSEGGEGS